MISSAQAGQCGSESTHTMPPAPARHSPRLGTPGPRVGQLDLNMALATRLLSVNILAWELRVSAASF